MAQTIRFRNNKPPNPALSKHFTQTLGKVTATDQKTQKRKHLANEMSMKENMCSTAFLSAFLFFRSWRLLGMLVDEAGQGRRCRLHEGKSDLCFQGQSTRKEGEWKWGSKKVLENSSRKWSLVLTFISLPHSLALIGFTWKIMGRKTRVCVFVNFCKTFLSC